VNETDPSPRWTRAERLQLAALAGGLLASLPFYVAARFDATDVDASMYIVLARSLARGEGYRYLGSPFILHPPGMAALLAPIVGTAGARIAALNLFGCLCGAAAVLLLFVHQRARVGGALALLTAACLWLDPGFRLQCNRVLSDVPGLALLLLCLILERRAARARLLRSELALGLVIGLSAYVRFANILILPAILAARTIERVRTETPAESWPRFLARRAAPCALAAIAVVAPWSLRNAALAPPPPADQTQLYTISTAMWHTDPGDPRSPRFSLGEILARPRGTARPIAAALGSGLQSPSMDEPPSPVAGRAWASLAGLLGICLLAVLIRRRAAAPEIYAFGMTLFFLFYFTFATRLALPIYAIGLAAVFDTAGSALRRFLPARPALVVAGAGALAALFIVSNLATRGPRVDLDARHREDLAIAAAVGPLIAPEDRLASSRGPRWSVYLDRPVYNLRHAVRRAGRADAVETIIDTYGIDAVLLRPADPDDRPLARYFRDTYGPGIPAASGLLWRLPPRAQPTARNAGAYPQKGS